MKPAFLPLGPRQLPRVHAQCHSPATEPGHDTYHPQALLWGYTTGEWGRGDKSELVYRGSSLRVTHMRLCSTLLLVVTSSEDVAMVSPTTRQTQMLKLGTGAGREVDSRARFPPLIAVSVYFLLLSLGSTDWVVFNEQLWSLRNQEHTTSMVLGRGPPSCYVQTWPGP